jgi:hypothetical protein
MEKDALIKLLLEVFHQSQFGRRLPDNLREEVRAALFSVRVFGVK